MPSAIARFDPGSTRSSTRRPTNPEPAHGRRHRLEHIETIDPADIGRFGKLGVIASMQPYHSLPDPALMRVWTASIGEERAARGWLYGSIARAGGLLAFGSDWPVATMDPLLGIHVAVNRTTPEGVPADGWLPAERLTLRQAIDAYTRNAAWASFDEHRKGSLQRDMLADIVVLTKDIFALPDLAPVRGRSGGHRVRRPHRLSALDGNGQLNLLPGSFV